MKKRINLLIVLSLLYAVDYETQIQPIFNANCTNCHGYPNQYGNLVLFSYNDVMNSGTVVAGDAESSSLYDRIVRPNSDPGDMPPGNDELSTSEIALIEQWINEGALAEEANDVIGCADPNAISCDDDIDTLYFPECTSCSEGVACDNYYNPDATIDNGECMYNDVPLDNELNITMENNGFFIEWSQFQPPVDILSYTLFRCIDSDGILNGDGTDYERCVFVLPSSQSFTGNEFFDSASGNDLETYVINGSGLLKYTFSVHYPNNNYWGSANGTYYYVEEIECILGDVSGDGIINVIDIVSLVNHILGSNILDDTCAADLNSDGVINVIDIVSLVNLILS